MELRVLRVEQSVHWQSETRRRLRGVHWQADWQALTAGRRKEDDAGSLSLRFRIGSNACDVKKKSFTKRQVQSLKIVVNKFVFNVTFSALSFLQLTLTFLFLFILCLTKKSLLTIMFSCSRETWPMQHVTNVLHLADSARLSQVSLLFADCYTSIISWT